MIENKSNEEANRQSAGYNGSRHISGTDPVNCKAIGFQAWENTVIASIKDEDDVEQLTNTGWNTVTIPEGYTIWFGFITKSITLTSGSGQYYLAE